MRRILIASLAATLGSAALAAESDWPSEAWNPVPEQDDMTLPMPCGGAMAFRRVATSLKSSGDPRQILADRPVMLGRSDPKDGIMDFSRTEYLSAPFLDGSVRYFLIGKYEVTRRQFDAVMNDSCAQEDPESDSIPANGVSWYDAVEFTRRLNRFWYKEAREKLPKSGGAPGYARLPSEAEWEFSARGGLQVSDAQRQDLRFPFDSGLELRDYAFYSDTQSSDGVLNDIGLLKPNPLGLYDVLGNVAEITFESFRMNRAGRLHGQRGGFVVKGGSYLNEDPDVNSAARNEFPFFNERTGDEFRSDELGLRIVVSASVLSDLGSINALRQAWGNLGEGTLPESDDPIKTLRAIAEREDDQHMKKRIESAAAAFLAREVQGQEIRERLISTSLLSAGYLQKTICGSKREIALLEKWSARLEKLAQDNPDDPSYKSGFEKNKINLDAVVIKYHESAEIFADQVIRFINDFSDNNIRELENQIVEELKARRREILGQNVSAFVDIIEESRANNLRSIEDITNLVHFDNAKICPG